MLSAQRLGAWTAVFALLLSACAGADVSFNPRFRGANVRRVALVSFEGPGGGAAADFLAHEFLKSGADVVERSRLESILTEQRLASSGVLDPATIRRAGKILGVDAVVVGSVTQYAPPQSFYVPGAGSATVTVQSASALGNGTLYSQAPAFGGSNANIVTSAAVVGLTARMVDVETGSVIWSARQTWEGFDTDAAMSSIAASFARSLAPFWGNSQPHS
ncbi:MAG: CsgG/HfaB family protein [Elusimicrobiota bacterium]|jgi:curli biogenesis system outer membrane secretion channel CsgG